MSAAAAFVAMLIKSLAPWLWGLIVTGISAAGVYIANKIRLAKKNSIQKEADKKVEEDIKNGVPLEQRQKDETDAINS